MKPVERNESSPPFSLPLAIAALVFPKPGSRGQAAPLARLRVVERATARAACGRPSPKPSRASWLLLALVLSLSAAVSSPSRATPMFGAPYLSFDTGWGPQGVVIGDLDGDGALDIVTANHDVGGHHESTVSVC